jgi:hypothetical protein
MSIRRQQGLAGLTLDELADRAGDAEPGSVVGHAFEMEFLKRQTEYHRETGRAAIETAAATKRSSNYMLWAVIILAVSTVANVIIQLAK